MLLTFAQPSFAQKDRPVAVIYPEGLVHGFLVLKNQQGEIVANGELIQSVDGDNRVKSNVVFHFKDGSLHEESTIFSQHRYFRLLRDHLVEKGPAFKHQMDVSINGATGQVTVQSTDDHGKEEVFSQRLALPSDVANGLVLTLIKNIPPDAKQMTVSLLAATPKPRLVKLQIMPEGEDTFSVGESSRKATLYTTKVDIGGVAGAVAPIVGKQPPDTHTWILQGDAPVLMKSEGPLFDGGPDWTIELVSPVGPKQRPENHHEKQ